MDEKTIKIVEAAEAEMADRTICISVKEMPFPPNPNAFKDVCVDCGVAVWVHPLSPKKPKKYCFSCIEKYLQEDEDNGDETAFITRMSRNS